MKPNKPTETDKEEFIDDSIFNMIIERKKKDMHPIKFAYFLKMFREKRGWSQREAARQFDISHSNWQDWELLADISLADYNNLKNKGLNKTEIYRLMRADRKVAKKTKIQSADIDTRIDEIIKILNSLAKSPKGTQHTLMKLHRAKDKLNVLEMRVERWLKRGIVNG